MQYGYLDKVVVRARVIPNDPQIDSLLRYDECNVSSQDCGVIVWAFS
jgi:hypothetical protein